MTDSVIITSAPTCTVEVVPTVVASVEVVQDGSFDVNVVSQQQTAIELGMANIGLRGPVGPVGPIGPDGPNEIGGFPIAVTDAKENDTLLLKSWAWTNTPQEALTDGGNF